MLHWHLWLFTDSTWLIQLGDGVRALSKDRHDNKYRVVSRHRYVPVLGTYWVCPTIALGTNMHSQFTHKCAPISTLEVARAQLK